MSISIVIFIIEKMYLQTIKLNVKGVHTVRLLGIVERHHRISKKSQIEIVHCTQVYTQGPIKKFRVCTLKKKKTKNIPDLELATILF